MIMKIGVFIDLFNTGYILLQQSRLNQTSPFAGDFVFPKLFTKYGICHRSFEESG